jgi:hypothetical protein
VHMALLGELQPCYSYQRLTSVLQAVVHEEDIPERIMLNSSNLST